MQTRFEPAVLSCARSEVCLHFLPVFGTANYAETSEKNPVKAHQQETASPEGTFCDTVQVPSSAGDMELNQIAIRHGNLSHHPVLFRPSSKGHNHVPHDVHRGLSERQFLHSSTGESNTSC